MHDTILIATCSSSTTLLATTAINVAVTPAAFEVALHFMAMFTIIDSHRSLALFNTIMLNIKKNGHIKRSVVECP